MSTSRWIQVDDTDSEILYAGSWFQDNGSQNNLGNFGLPFQGTLHGTKSDGSFSYSFRGSRVLITGTVQYPYTSGVSNPSWQCIIDGESVDSLLYTTPQNRLRLCERDGMDATQLHTITVKVSVSDQHTFWLDYVQYLPPDSTTVNNAIVSIDSSDTAMQFNGAADWKASYPGYVALTAGAGLTFQFQGISIMWVGFYDKQFPMKATTATYSIDGQAPTTFNLDGSGANGPGLLNNQIFFKSNQLSSGTHTLRVVYQGSSDLTPLSIYTLVVQNGPGDGSSGGSGSGSGPVTGGSGISGAVSDTSTKAGSTTVGTITGTIGSGTSTTMAGLSVTSPPNPATAASSGSSSTVALASAGSQSSSSNIGPIVGGVVGGLALILLAIFGFLLLRRRNKQESNPNASIVEPFGYSQMSSHQSPTNPSDPFSDQPIVSSSYLQPLRATKRAQLHNQVTEPSQTSPEPSFERTIPSRYGGKSSLSNTQNSSSSRNPEHLRNTSTSPSSVSTSDPQISSGVVVAVDEDSGIRFPRTMEGGQVVETLPPVYTMV